MLHYLRIFSWFLFTFGVAGFFMTGLGLFGDVGPKDAAMGIMALQAAAAGLVLYGFKRHKAGQLHESVLLFFGWLLIIAMVITGQVWMSASGVRIGFVSSGG
ncbi:hypothetical protein Q4485_03685 [Granulosicoccaceae sp. 1_MG-2023]|nr:hypothetical protein [Granulosicoccaceae sp. 1_MG-2023]